MRRRMYEDDAESGETIKATLEQRGMAKLKFNDEIEP